MRIVRGTTGRVDRVREQATGAVTLCVNCSRPAPKEAAGCPFCGQDPENTSAFRFSLFGGTPTTPGPEKPIK